MTVASGSRQSGDPTRNSLKTLQSGSPSKNTQLGGRSRSGMLRSGISKSSNSSDGSLMSHGGSFKPPSQSGSNSKLAKSGSLRSASSKSGTVSAGVLFGSFKPFSQSGNNSKLGNSQSGSDSSCSRISSENYRNDALGKSGSSRSGSPLSGTFCSSVMPYGKLSNSQFAGGHGQHLTSDTKRTRSSGSCVSGKSRTVPDWMVMLLVSAFASGCYLNSLHGHFVHDDLVAVSGNPDVNGRNGWTAMLRNDFWGRPMADPASHKSYRPLTVLTFRLNWRLFGEGVFSFHATNVLLHCCVVCLLLRLCTEVMEWRRDASLVAALMFAAHPVHAEAVSNIVGRADVLCCVFYLSSIIASSKDSLWCELASAGLALFAKEQGITVLGVCLVRHALLLLVRTTTLSSSGEETGCRLMDNGTTLRILARMAALLAAACALCCLRLCIINGPLPHFSEHDNPAAFAKPWTTRFLTYLYLPAFNLWLLLCPSVLSYDWQMGSVPLVERLSDPRNAASAAYLLLLLLMLLEGISRTQEVERRRLLLPLSVAVFSFLPASNLLVTVGFVAAERVLYIPSVGFCLLVSHGLQRLMQRGGAAVALACRLGALLLVLLFVLKTMGRNNVWANREALLRSGLESVPHNAKMHYNYANYKKDVGDRSAAVDHYRTALRLWPDYYTAHNNLGTLLEDGEENFRQAIAINPYYAKAYYNLASLYVRRGKAAAAESLLLRAIRLQPEFVSAVSSLASLYAEAGGRAEEAERLYAWATSLDPEDADVRNNYGFFLETHGRPQEALRQYERAMRAQPNHTVAILNAARSLRSPEHGRRAEELYKRALSIHEDPQVQDNLATLYFASGRLHEARTMYADILARHPDRNDTKLHYAQLLIQERRFEEAEGLLLSLAPSSSSEESPLLHLATLYSRTNRTAEALDTILRALHRCPPASDAACAKFHEEHGDILKDMDDYAAAEESYRLALALDPTLAKTHQNLAVIYHMKGKYTSAEHHYREAYKLDSSPEVLLDNMRKLQRTRVLDQEDTPHQWRTGITSPCRGGVQCSEVDSFTAEH